MKKQDKTALTAVWMAGLVLFWAAFAPQTPRAAWWCTAFSITCGEAAEESEIGEKQVEFRSFLLDRLVHKDNT